MATNSRAGSPSDARSTLRPMRPNPLMPMRIAMVVRPCPRVVNERALAAYVNGPAEPIRLRPHVPRREVLLLLLREAVDADVYGGELEAGDFLVHHRRDR